MCLKNNLILFSKLLFIITLMISCKKEQHQLKEGDILFQDLDKDSIDNAIEKVTQTSLKYNFTHVGIVVKHQNKLAVLEAISTGVQQTPVTTFLNRNLKNGKPKVVVGKLNGKFKPALKEAIKHGKTLIGNPYDNVYKIGDSSYYCSELLYEMFHHANPNLVTFKLSPMTFKDSETNKTLPFWESYYADLDTEIPEGELGLNPNGMSISPNIKLVYDYLDDRKLN